VGARSGADQDQQRDTADKLVHERLLLATSLPQADMSPCRSSTAATRTRRRASSRSSC
jgi:hypothetical protein